MTQLGPGRPVRADRYESRAFGDEYRDNLFAALFNLRKVTRHVLDAERRDVHRPRRPTSWSRTTSTSTRPTCSRTPTAACWWSTPAAGTSCAARRRSWRSRTCWAAIYRVRRTGRAGDRRPARAEARLEHACRPPSWRRCWTIPRPAVRGAGHRSELGARGRRRECRRSRTSMQPSQLGRAPGGTPCGRDADRRCRGPRGWRRRHWPTRRDRPPGGAALGERLARRRRACRCSVQRR